MRSRAIPGRRVPRGPFPRPNLTMRELIGLVLAFAISNAFLAWTNPAASAIPVLAALWNSVLAAYLGFAFFQAWVRSALRWYRTGDADPPGPPRRWTALGVAEATVIGGTMIWCMILVFVQATNPFVHVHGRDWTAPIAILLLGSAAAVMVLRMWRAGSGDSLTGRGAGSTMEGGSSIERGETS